MLYSIVDNIQTFSDKIAIKMRLWVQTARQTLAKNKKYKSGNEGIISKSLSDLSMSGSAVSVDGPRFMTNMRSEKQDGIQYLSVDDLDRRRYWKTGEERDDYWRRLSRPKLSLLVAAKKLGLFNTYNKTL